MKYIKVLFLLAAILTPQFAFAQSAAATKLLSMPPAAKTEGPFDYEAFLVASKNGDTAQMEAILKGIKLNEEYSGGNFPLGVAAESGNIRAVEFLLGKGADINFFSTERKSTALCRAAVKQNTTVIDYLLKKKADIKKCSILSFIMVGPSDLPKEVASYIKSGASVEQIGAHNMPPVIVAAMYAKPKSLEVLLQNKANPNETLRDLTPLSVAVVKNMGDPVVIEVLDVLTKHGATLKASNAVIKKVTLQDICKERETLLATAEEKATYKKVIAYLDKLAAKEGASPAAVAKK